MMLGRVGPTRFVESDIDSTITPNGVRGHKLLRTRHDKNTYVARNNAGT